MGAWEGRLQQEQGTLTARRGAVSSVASPLPAPPPSPSFFPVR